MNQDNQVEWEKVAEGIVRKEAELHYVGHEVGNRDEKECDIFSRKPCDCPWKPYEDALIKKFTAALSSVAQDSYAEGIRRAREVVEKLKDGEELGGGEYYDGYDRCRNLVIIDIAKLEEELKK